VDLFLLERDLVCILGLWPEVRYGEAVFEIGAEVVHPGYRKHDIHSKLLSPTLVKWRVVEWGMLTLNISRLGPPIATAITLKLR
jgi:hypothetical protein